MKKIVGVAIGAALLLTTEVADFASAAPEDEMLAAVVHRAAMDQKMAQLAGVLVSVPPEGVLGVQAYRDNLTDATRLDMLAVIGHRVDMDRGQAEAPH